jgi:tetratricopeptide (TPR) repeat protein
VRTFPFAGPALNFPRLDSKNKFQPRSAAGEEFMAFFDGMYSYEIILLVGGVLLFLVLLAALLRKVFSNEPFSALLPFFGVAVLMIGFPAWSSVKVSDGVVEIDKKTHDLQEHPEDVALRSSLQSDVSKLSARPFNNPRIVTTLAQAQFALGQEEQAKQNLDKALAVDPALKPAQELKAKIEVADKLSALTAAAEKQPENAQVKQELQSVISQASQYKFANPKAVISMKKATTILQAQPVSGAGHINPAILATPAGTPGNSANH